jgi:hypothetical protein
MRATVEVGCQHGVWADLRIVNDTAQVVRVRNPGDHRPTEGWEHSREAYNVAVLRSFHALEMTLTTEGGSVVEPAAIATRADHLVGLPVALEPGADLRIRIPLHEFYELRPGTDYSLALVYGDVGGRVSATTRFRCP